MKNLVIKTLLVFVGMTSFAQADQLVCRGKEITLKITDVIDGVIPSRGGSGIRKPFAGVQVFTAKYDQGIYADLFTSFMIESPRSVEQVLNRRRPFETVSRKGGVLTVDVANLQFSLSLPGRAYTTTETMNCTVVPKNVIYIGEFLRAYFGDRQSDI